MHGRPVYRWVTNLENVLGLCLSSQMRRQWMFFASSMCAAELILGVALWISGIMPFLILEGSLQNNHLPDWCSGRCDSSNMLVGHSIFVWQEVIYLDCQEVFQLAPAPSASTCLDQWYCPCIVSMWLLQLHLALPWLCVWQDSWIKPQSLSWFISIIMFHVFILIYMAVSWEEEHFIELL